MKYIQNIKLSLLLCVTLLALGSCTKDAEYTPGESENENVAGVYFPMQTAFKDMSKIEIATTDPTEFKLTLRRTNTTEEITVPLHVDCTDAEVFTTSELHFYEGQTESEVTVSFPAAEIGVSYYCEVSIDPEYCAIYNTKAITTDFTLIRVDWKQLLGANGETLGKWRDDFFSNYSMNYFAEREVEIFERCDKPGMYKIENIYTGEFFADCVGRPGESYPDNRRDATTIIDATNPDKVWIPTQDMGFFVSTKEGWFSFGSVVDENDLDGDQYGKLVDGVITFPARSIACFMSNLNDGYYVNLSEMFRVMLPGVKDNDYEVEITHETSKAGAIPITFALGEDIAKVEYAYFEGNLSETLVAAKSIDMDADIIEVQELTQSGTLTVSLSKSGIYTIVANAYNKEGEIVNCESDYFGYIAAGDDRSVVLTLGADLTDRYNPEGYDTSNSINGWLYGEDIVEAYYKIYRTKEMNSMSSSDLTADVVDDGASFSEEELELINGNGFAFMLGNLYSGCDYSLVVYAYNNYSYGLFTAEQTTTGELKPIYDFYSDKDINDTISKEDLFQTWNLWAVNNNSSEDNKQRQILGTWSFSEAEDNETLYPGKDLIALDGVALNKVDKEDTTLWEYYNGYVYSLESQYLGSFVSNGQVYYRKFYVADLTKGELFEDEERLIIGGMVSDGYMAFVTNTSQQSEYNSSSILIAVFKDEDCTINNGNMGLYYDIMLENPSITGSTTPSPTLNRVMEASINADNFVELRGRDRIRAAIDEVNGGQNTPTFSTEMLNSRSVRATSTIKAQQAKMIGEVSFSADNRLLNY